VCVFERKSVCVCVCQVASGCVGQYRGHGSYVSVCVFERESVCVCFKLLWDVSDNAEGTVLLHVSTSEFGRESCLVWVSFAVSFIGLFCRSLL